MWVEVWAEVWVEVDRGREGDDSIVVLRKLLLMALPLSRPMGSVGEWMSRGDGAMEVLSAPAVAVGGWVDEVRCLF